MKFIKKRRKLIVSIALTLVFAILTIIVAQIHEPWADETQAWLIAKDSSVFTLLTKYLRNEGHLILWFLILKMFKAAGLSFEQFWIIPIIFSSLGVFIFLFFSKFKWYIKLLFTFSYFTFYQYPIVARGYCLVLLFLGVVAIIWEKRIQHPYFFSLSLILLLSIEPYTYLIAGSAYLIYMYDYVKLYKTRKQTKNHLISLILTGVSFLFTAAYAFPVGGVFFKHYITPFYISDSFISSSGWPDYVKAILSILLLIYVFYCYKKNNKMKEFSILLLFLLPVFLFNYVVYSRGWHYGLFLFFFMFVIWIQNFTKCKRLNILLLVCLSVQCIWTFKTTMYDYKNVYHPAKEVTNFIKKYDYKNLKIFGVTFFENAINAYFDENIFNNWDKQFYYFNLSSKYFHTSINKDKYDIIVFSNSDYPDYVEFNDFYNKHSNEYNMYKFYGHLYFEDHYDYPTNETVLVLKEIDTQK